MLQLSYLVVTELIVQGPGEAGFINRTAGGQLKALHVILSTKLSCPKHKGLPTTPVYNSIVKIGNCWPTDFEQY